MKIRIGITGQNGFIGSHLYHTIRLLKEEFVLVDFDRLWFAQDDAMDAFVKQCDVIVHLAALNRHHNPSQLLDTNISLVIKLFNALERTHSNPQIVFSSSTQEFQENHYARSKKEGRILLADWASKHGACFTGLIIPNVFGPFAKPFYNSVVATFCYQIVNGQKPELITDADLDLIYIGELVEVIIEKIRSQENNLGYTVLHTSQIKVSAMLTMLRYFEASYLNEGTIPLLGGNKFDLNLLNTFRSYINPETYFPQKYISHADDRGVFVELIRNYNGGQVSFSTTLPGKIRGNHFHTRKIERFMVIKGIAQVQLRKIGTNEIIQLELSGAQPAYVDIPVWCTHNLINIGIEPLITVFWISELYNPNDPDTFFELV